MPPHADRQAPGRPTRCSPCGSSPSMVRSSSSGAPVDHACGLQAVGYWTGYLVSSAGSRRTPRAAGRRSTRAASRMPSAIAGGLLVEAVAAQTPGDEGVVERPDRADVVADRVVAVLALGQRADAPAGEELRPEQVRGDRAGPASSTMPLHSRCPMLEVERVDLPPVGVERERVVLAVRHPEVAVEPPLQVGRLRLQPVGVRRVVPELAGQPGAPHLRVVRVPLQLAGGPRERRQRPSRYKMESQESFQHWFSSPVSVLRRWYADVAVADAGRRTRRSSPAPPAPRARAPGPARRRRSSARTRRAARRRAAWRRRSRSTASAAAPRRRPSRRTASRAGSCPAPRRGSRRAGCPAARRGSAAWSRPAPA